MHEEWIMNDRPSPYDQMRAYQEYDLSRLGGTAEERGSYYERIDNPLNVYIFEDKAVIICEDGRVVEYARI